MMVQTQHIIKALFGTDKLENISVDQLRELVHEYPSFNIGHYLLSKKLQPADQVEFLQKTRQTALYFHNPFWLLWLLKEINEPVGSSWTATEKPVHESNTSRLEDNPQEIFPVTGKAAIDDQSGEENNDPLPYTRVMEESTPPVHPVDEFRKESILFTDNTASFEYSSDILEFPTFSSQVTDEFLVADAAVNDEETLPDTESMRNSSSGFEASSMVPTAEEKEVETAMPSDTKFFSNQDQVNEKLPQSSWNIQKEAQGMEIIQDRQGSEQDIPMPTNPEPVSQLQTDLEQSTEPGWQTQQEMAVNPEPVFSQPSDPEQPPLHSWQNIELDAQMVQIPETTQNWSMLAEPEKSVDEVSQVIQSPDTSWHQPEQSVIVGDIPAPEEISGEVMKPADLAGPVLDTSTAEEPRVIPIQKEETSTDLIFDPYHTIDYFVSQGIKLVIDENPEDQFGKQLKSFTDWLKIMKRQPAKAIEASADEALEADVEVIAAHSIEEKDVITETMAGVWAKQGNTEKAIGIYRKLSLLDPGKSSYFASRIEELKTK